jgi:predicted O-linked N-acetylglucosamine transferase (SPINDLY family)
VRAFKKVKPKPRPAGEAAPNPPPAVVLAIQAQESLKVGDLVRAGELYRRAVRIDPHLATAWHGLGVEAARQGRDAEANACFLRGVAGADFTLRALPGNHHSLVVRAACYYALSLPLEAAESARRALDIAPEPNLHRALLCMMNFLPDTTPESKYAEACRWDSLYAAPLAPGIRRHANLPAPERRIRLGYLSPDLYTHTLIRFLQPVFEHHDRSRFEVFAYSVGAKVDESTERARAAVEHFVPFDGSGRDLAERIRADGIDILVELAGNSMPWEFLQTLALKPAPIQVSWVGLPGTTGLSTMDYFLGDAQMPRPGTEHLFRETVYRLPRAACCYRFMDIPVAPSPCLQRGYITFGCFNQPMKITREVVRLWSAILRAVPRSCLLLKYKGMESEVFQDRFQSWIAKEGVARDRLRFAGYSPLAEYLAAYGGIDIALDPFPYNGGSTSLDAVYMGVPLVTLTGRLAVQCGGASLLRTIGLSDMVAETPERYLETAVSMAGMVPKMPDIRRDMRQALLSSPFLDEAGAVRDVEDAFRNMWRAWCRKQPENPGARAEPC